MSLSNSQPVPTSAHNRIYGKGVVEIKPYVRNVKMNTCEKFWIYVWSLGLAYEDFGDAGEIGHNNLYRTTYSKFYKKFHPVGVANYRKTLKHPEKWRPTPMPRLSKLRLAGLVPRPIAAPRTARTLAHITC